MNFFRISLGKLRPSKLESSIRFDRISVVVRTVVSRIDRKPNGTVGPFAVRRSTGSFESPERYPRYSHGDPFSAVYIVRVLIL